MKFSEKLSKFINATFREAHGEYYEKADLKLMKCNFIYAYDDQDGMILPKTNIKSMYPDWTKKIHALGFGDVLQEECMIFIGVTKGMFLESEGKKL